MVVLQPRWVGTVVEGSSATLLEIKCPYSRANADIVNYENCKSHVPYLTFDDRCLKLKQSHAYYTQVQVAMYVANVIKTHLYVYSSQQQVMVEIKRDEIMLSHVIPKLEHFYFTFLLPQLVQ